MCEGFFWNGVTTAVTCALAEQERREEGKTGKKAGALNNNKTEGTNMGRGRNRREHGQTSTQNRKKGKRHNHYNHTERDIHICMYRKRETDKDKRTSCLSTPVPECV